MNEIEDMIKDLENINQNLLIHLRVSESLIKDLKKKIKEK